MVTEPPSKRAKTEGELSAERPSSPSNGEGANGGGLIRGDPTDDVLLDPISPDVLRRSDELAASYRDARPYPHGLIRSFCKDGFLGKSGVVDIERCCTSPSTRLIDPNLMWRWL